jgi:hypothetical protein
MPTYDTPEPIDLAINLKVGHVDIIATDRLDTVVTVSPRSESRPVDRRGVDDTDISFDGKRLSVIGPRPRLSWIGPGPFDTVDVKVELPTGSRLSAEVSVGHVHTAGRLGATRIKCSTGAIEVDQADDLWLRAAHGGATVGSADGGVDITSSHGQIRLGKVTGDAVLRSSYGGIQIARSGGDVDAKLSYGDLEISKALASVTAKTAYGTIRLDEVSSGSVDVESGYGQVTVGVRAGTAAWLDLMSKDGRVNNGLSADAAPGPDDDSLAIRVRTQSGDITIRRAGEPHRTPTAAKEGTGQ